MKRRSIFPPGEVDSTDVFINWLKRLNDAGQEKVEALIRLLEANGPDLGRPYADRAKGSTIHHLKELRPSSSQKEALRILYYFDSARKGVLLVGGDKAGDWDGWYAANIPIAERLIAEHEASFKRNQLTRKAYRGRA